MRAAEHRRRPRCDLRWLTLIGGLISVTPGHADVEFDAGISVGVAHTDNLTLSSTNPERETVYQLFPAFTLRQESTRTNTDVSYRVEAYRYDKRSDNESYQNLNVNSQVALDPDNFFLDLGASRDQTIRDPEAAIPRSNLVITTNRVDRDDYYVGPEFQYPFGSNGTVRGNYRRTRTRYDEDESASFFAVDFDEDTFGLSVDNYRKESGFTWAVRYNADKTDYGVFLPWEYRQAAVEIGAWIAQGSRLFATGGRESAWATPLDPSLADGFWEIGFARQGGETLMLEVAAGERTCGSSRRASLDYSFGRGRTQLSYVEQPTTERRSRGSLLDVSDLLAGVFDDLLARPGDAQRFLLNRLDWSLGFDLRRTQISLAIFDESRKERARIDGAPLEDEGQSGGAFAVGWRLGARTGLQVRADRSRREFGTDREQDVRYVSIGADYRLAARTSLALYLTRAEEYSQGSGFQDYEADLISLLLTRNF